MDNSSDPTPLLDIFLDNLYSPKDRRLSKEEGSIATGIPKSGSSESSESSEPSFEDPNDSDFDIRRKPECSARLSRPVWKRSETIRRRRTTGRNGRKQKTRSANKSSVDVAWKNVVYAEGSERKLSDVARTEISDYRNDMAPGYRNTNSRRSGRGHIDHDVYEGLPVRQWRRDVVYVAPPPAQDGLDNVQDKWDVELPWGMPKDSHLLPQHAQDLLRAARSGRIYKRSLPVEEEVDDVDGILGEKSEKKEDTNKDKGFAAKTWKQVPRHMEGPDIEYLAKRRKGLQTPSQPTATSAGPAMTRVTVRRTDAAGNAYQEVIVVPQGQPVDGDIVTQTPLVDTSAAAPQNAAAAQPARIVSRKPPIPKGKRKGPGRGRKKKILAPTSVPGPSPAQLPTNETLGAEQAHRAINSSEGPKISLKTESSTNEDTEMGDDSQHPSDDEGDDGEEGEEGEIIESDDDQDGSADGESTPTPAADNNGLGSRGGKSVPSAPATAMKSVNFAHPSIAHEDKDARGSPDVLSTFKTVSSAGKEGSPLKTVQVVKEEKSSETEKKEPVETMQKSDDEVPKIQQQPEPITTAPVTDQSESSTLSIVPEPNPEIAAAPPASSSKENPPPPNEQTEVVTAADDEMLLDTIEESEHLPVPTGADDGDANANAEGAAGEPGGSRERSREESEFPDLMGSLERHLDGNRRD